MSQAREPTSDGRTTACHEADAKSVTRIPGFVDPWFLSRYGMNLYRGCEHGCAYCDGRAEKYYVPGDFARDIRVKRNAIPVLARELERVREPGFVFLGGGVCDAYQPAEARYGLARGVLELALQHRLPVHVLTKSTLVEQDLPLLEELQAQRQVVLSCSISLLDESDRERFEAGAAPLEERWRLLAEAKRRGLGAGVMIMPVLPGISDQPEAIDALVARAAALELDFACFGGLTLRPGRQKDGFLEQIAEQYPSLLEGYQVVYRTNRESGAGAARYYDRINRRYFAALEKYGLPGRLPRRLFQGQIPTYAEAAVLLEHREFERSQAGQPGGGLARAGHAIQQWARGRFAAKRLKTYNHRAVQREFLAKVRERTLLELPHVNVAALRVVEEVLGLTS
ncbi:MAG: radical SAM protein [bacterium]